MLSLPVVCRAERLYCDKNMKPCKARKAAYYRDVDTLAGGKLSVRTYRLKDTSLYSRGVYMSLFPDKADTLLLYDEAGKLKEQETYGANDLCNTSRYYPSGELKAVSTAFGAKGRRSYTSWYSNKQLRYKYQTVAVSGIQELDGEVLSYYPNGKLKRKERYVKGVMQGKKCPLTGGFTGG